MMQPLQIAAILAVFGQLFCGPAHATWLGGHAAPAPSSALHQVQTPWWEKYKKEEAPPRKARPKPPADNAPDVTPAKPPPVGQPLPPSINVLPSLAQPTGPSKSAAASAIAKGFTFLRDGKVDMALAEFDRALIADPNSANAYTGRGVGLALKGRYDHAMADLDKAVQIAPRKSDAYLFRGMVFLMRGEPDRALTQIDQSLLLTPNVPMAHMLRGDAYLLKNDPDRALESIEKSMATKPTTQGLVQRARAYALKKDHKRAVAELDKAIAKGPTTSAMYGLRAHSQEVLGDKERAIADYKSALAIAPKDARDIAIHVIAQARIKAMSSGATPSEGCKKGEVCL